MIDVYIDDIKIKSLGYDGDKNQLAIENGENKAMLIFDDEVLYQLYILLKNRGEMKGLIPLYNKLEPTIVKLVNDIDVAKVVRCKDCAYHREAYYEDEGDPPRIKEVCDLFNRTIQLNDFCSYGERTNEE